MCWGRPGGPVFGLALPPLKAAGPDGEQHPYVSGPLDSLDFTSVPSCRFLSLFREKYSYRVIVVLPDIVANTPPRIRAPLVMSRLSGPQFSVESTR